MSIVLWSLCVALFTALVTVYILENNEDSED